MVAEQYLSLRKLSSSEAITYNDKFKASTACSILLLFLNTLFEIEAFKFQIRFFCNNNQLLIACYAATDFPAKHSP
jgi:hypothetical protein